MLRAARLADLVELGSLTGQAARFLEAAVLAGLNIVVAGGTQAGKTTFLNCLAAAIPGGDRVISAEEVFELRFPHPDWVPMQTRQQGLEGTGEVTLRDLVREALRMRPTRMIVGEVRLAECLDLLLALNAGLPGLATIHANSAREALVKLCTLPLLAGENYPIRKCGSWGEGTLPMFRSGRIAVTSSGEKGARSPSVQERRRVHRRGTRS